MLFTILPRPAMLRPAAIHGLMMLVLTGNLLVFPVNSVAAEEKPTRLVTQARSASDEWILQTRQANARGHIEGLDKLLATPTSSDAAKHPLAMYPSYWALRLRLADSRTDPASQHDGAVRDYLSNHTNTIAADLLRRDWLVNLGKRREWTAFAAQYPLWMLRDDNQVFCYELEMRAQKAQLTAEEKAQIKASARTLLNQLNASGRDFSDACSRMIESLVTAEIITTQQAQARIYAAIDANYLGQARKMAQTVPVWRDGSAGVSFETALTKPGQVIAQGRPTESVLAAYAKLARQSPEQAAQLLSSSTNTTANIQIAWGWIAAAGARKHSPESAEWARRALTAPSQHMELLNRDTLQWVARGLLRDGDWKSLAQWLDKSTDLANDETWIYWRGKAAAHSNDIASAQHHWRKILPNHSFYGQLASEELGELRPLPARATPPSAQEIAAWNNNPGFLRARKFYELGLRFEGNREWNWQLRGLNDRQLLAVAEWARKEGMLDRTVNTSDRTTTEFDFTQRFPTPLRDLMHSATQERQLDMASVYGLIRQESRFIQDVSSSVGAQGLMQIMPGTGRWIATKLGVKDFKVPHLSDPETNVRFGSFYLKTVLDEFDGSLALAAAAYNAGPSRSRTWRASLKGSIDAAAFAETIPFTETRDYVKKVLFNATVYGQLLAGQNGSSAQALKTRLGAIAPKSAASTSDTP